MTLLDDLSLKFVKLRGPGKDVAAAITPIFAAMDTSKSGALDASEFKTCLLALGIKASAPAIVDLFASFEGIHARVGGRVAYAGFIKSVVGR